jgi:DNA polymerase-1
MAEANKKRLVILDAHAILHRAYHALPEFASSKGEPTGAVYGLTSMLIRIIDDLKPDYLVAAYDLPGPTYRHEAYEGYKAQRKEAEPELKLQMKRSRDIFTAFGVPIYDHQGFEADDIIGTIIEKLKKESNLEIIIGSGDMDTLQLVSGKRVRVYTLKRGLQDTVLYDEEAVKNRFGFGPSFIPDFKGLSGDPSDNIPGVAGIGEKTATALIMNFGSVEDIYRKLKNEPLVFKKAGFKERVIELLRRGEEEAEFSKMLATIHRDVPINFALPTQSWREGVNPEKIDRLFRELEFRTLRIRVKELLEKNKEISARRETASSVVEDVQILKNNKQGAGEARATENAPVAELFEARNPKEVKEVGLMLSLVNSNITDPTAEEILRFTGEKTMAGARKKLEAELRRRKMERVWLDIEQPLIPVIEQMMERGVKIDIPYLKDLSKTYHQKMRELAEKIWKLAGGEFNIASPKQLGEVLFDKLGLKIKNQKKTEKTGALSTRESELEKLRDNHPIIPFVLEYRELAKLLNAYIDALPSLADGAGRLHTTFIQIGAATGRMASRDPNLQNIPNKTELGRAIRKAFITEKGWRLVSLDYSQIELRVAAFLSGDRKLIDIFQRGEDVHASVAAEVFGVPGNKVHPEMRRQAKIINFGIMYGMGVNALRASLGGTREAAQKFLTDYFAKFSGLAAYLQKTKAQAASLGYTETFFGRRRYFDGFRSPLPYILAAAERMAINAPMQGTQADIIKIAMVRANEYIKQAGMANRVHLLLQVHDELVYEMEEDLVAIVAPQIKKIMETVILPKDARGVPLVADISVGENWGEMRRLTD